MQLNLEAVYNLTYWKIILEPCIFWSKHKSSHEPVRKGKDGLDLQIIYDEIP